MSELYYTEALKLGQKEKRRCAASGTYPYLPVLEEYVAADQIASGVSLGLIQIPAQHIVGTRTRGRSNSFARNFMPLLAENSEFAAKWQQLCQMHLAEGIHDAVKVYEYMNRYYVEEGHKRVSVLRFFGAVSISAEVVRILPERSQDLSVELYYEYLDFYRVSKINFLEFTRPGSIGDFQNLVGKRPGEPWSDPERSALKAVYCRFEEAYMACGGDRLHITAGDALLAVLRIYTYTELCEKSSAEMKTLVVKMWEELKLLGEPDPILVKLDPAAEKKQSIFQKAILPQEPKPCLVAFIHDKTPEASGWTNAHDLGRLHVERTMGDRIRTRAFYNAMDAGADEIIEEAISQGCTILFTTSPRLLPASLRAAVEHPNVTILNCSLNQPHRFLRTYYARMYEAKFIIGAIAGALAGTRDIGYIGDYPIFGQVAGINAFALGAQTTNPKAQIYLEWASLDSFASAEKYLTENGIQLISTQDLQNLRGGNGGIGLSLFTESGWVDLAVPVWEWGAFYEQMLRRILGRSFRSEYSESTKALNYFWGMNAGTVSVKCSENLPNSVSKLVGILEESMRAGLCDPFRGPVFAQGGKLQIPAGGTCGLEQLIGMNWLADNIIGRIPKYEELTDIGKATVDLMGVDKNLKETRSERRDA